MPVWGRLLRKPRFGTLCCVSCLHSGMNRPDLTLLDLLPGLGHAFIVVGEARCLALFEECDHARGAEFCLGQVFELLTFF